MTTPDDVRADLTVVTSAAVADASAVAMAAAAQSSPGVVRAALFAAVPLIVHDYIDGSAALALEWYEELREAAAPRHRFTPTPITVVNEDAIAASVAKATNPLRDLERDLDRLTGDLLREATEESLKLLAPTLQKDVASGFRDTVVGNTRQDPDAVGWRRYARPGACKFCRMLAAKGAVFAEDTVDFAAHGTCSCTCGPSYDPDAPRASVMQYVASRKRRTPQQRAVLREYLNENYPDAPG